MHVRGKDRLGSRGWAPIHVTFKVGVRDLNQGLRLEGYCC